MNLWWYLLHKTVLGIFFNDLRLKITKKTLKLGFQFSKSFPKHFELTQKLSKTINFQWKLFKERETIQENLCPQKDKINLLFLEGALIHISLIVLLFRFRGNLFKTRNVSLNKFKGLNLVRFWRVGVKLRHLFGKTKLITRILTVQHLQKWQQWTSHQGQLQKISQKTVCGRLSAL